MNSQLSMLASCAVDHLSMLTSCAVDHGCKPQSCQTKDYRHGICCFSVMHAALRRKNKDWSSLNQDNVSESACCLLFHEASTMKFQLSMLI